MSQTSSSPTRPPLAPRSGVVQVVRVSPSARADLRPSLLRPEPPAPDGAAPPTPVAVAPPALRARRPSRGMRIAALVVAAGIMVAGGFGVGFVIRQAQAETVPFSLYLTDKVGELTRLDVEVGAVKVGKEGSLRVLRPNFDLAGLHGPRDALLVAQGDIPKGESAPIRIQFTAVRATIDGQVVAITEFQDLVLGAVGDDPAATLVDIDIPSSVVEAAGALRFQPVAAAVYAVQTLREGEVPDFEAVEPMLPPLVTDAAGSVRTTAPSLPAPPDAGTLASGLTQAADPGDAQAPDASAEIQPGEAGVADATGLRVRTGWLVHFAEGVDREDEMKDVVEGFGAVLVHAFHTFPLAYVQADPLQVRLLQNDTRVVLMERELPIDFYGTEAKQAIRQPQVVHPVTGLKDAAGNPIDGRGVAVAVVDTGIDTLHPDLGMAPAGPVQRNVQILLDQAVDLPYNDVSGHGTHVAAIVAGQGIGDADAKGVAPGAKIVGVGAVAPTTIVWATAALEWVLEHRNDQTPPIRVVTNSWGTEEPSASVARYVNRLVDAGVVVVFAAGNDGGQGQNPSTSAQCQIDRPGVICVANYDDLGTGTRDGRIHEDSSRGDLNVPSTWPDISAPGTNVYSARPPEGLATGVGLTNPHYVRLTGTSQAAPHVAAVAAMMLQKNPALTPAQVQSHIEASAYKYADGGAYAASGSHVAKGFGLLDAYGAVQRA